VASLLGNIGFREGTDFPFIIVLRDEGPQPLVGQAPYTGRMRSHDQCGALFPTVGADMTMWAM
jgi:hypothetical protein